LKRYVCRRLRLRDYLQAPGDGRPRPQIPAGDLLWAQLTGLILREGTFHAVEAWVRSVARRALGVTRRFGDDALAYSCERLDPHPTRQALAATVRLAKRTKAFEHTWLIGLALDGTGAGRRRAERCALCHPMTNSHEEITSYLHRVCRISIVGTGLSLPVDVEPYGPGDCEYNAGQRLLTRTVQHLGRRFADYVVGDGEFATAPFLHLAGALGLRVIARLKGNLPELGGAAQARFAHQPPTQILQEGGEWIELWDADGFDPWETLTWETVRVLRYRQHKRDGTTVEAAWLTDFPARQVGSRTLYRLAKTRGEIENQGFNDGKTRYGMAHVAHHHANSVLVRWLLTCLALTIERLSGLRYLHRGTHRPHTAIALVRLLRLSLSPPAPRDTS
jgi:hypothetical protein